MNTALRAMLYVLGVMLGFWLGVLVSAIVR